MKRTFLSWKFSLIGAVVFISLCFSLLPNSVIYSQDGSSQNIQKAILGLLPASPELDLNGDGQINMADEVAESRGTSPYLSPQANTQEAADGVTVSISAPASVPPGGEFSVSVNVSEVSDLVAHQFDITYNPSVIQVTGPENGAGVTSGLIGPTTLPVSMWGFIPPGTPGTIRVLCSIYSEAASGSGYLAKIQFQAVGALSSSSDLTLSTVVLVDSEAQYILPLTLIGSSVVVSGAGGPPVAEAGNNRTVEANTVNGANVTLDGSGSMDPDGGQLTYAWSWPQGTASGAQPTIFLPLGNNTVSLVVNDGISDSPVDTVNIVVQDTTPPVITLSVNPEVLWPPNHQMRRITAAISAVDIADPSPRVVLTSITCNERITRGDISGARFGTHDLQFFLRAERNGHGPEGRVYTITYTARDSANNSSSWSATVTVPHDRRCN
jgi:hypothetical protein